MRSNNHLYDFLILQGPFLALLRILKDKDVKDVEDGGNVELWNIFMTTNNYIQPKSLKKKIMKMGET